MKKRFTKIKLKAGKVILAYEQLNKAGQWDLYSIESTEAPAPPFDGALQGLRCPFLDELELPGVEAFEITIGSVSLSYTEIESGTVRGATISGLRALKKSNSPLSLNSPYKPESPFSEGGDYDKCLQEDTVEALNFLIIQAEKYLDGDRAQTDMFQKGVEAINDSLGEGVSLEVEVIDFDDPLYNEAIRLVVTKQKASPSIIQRGLRVGYARAGRLLDELARNKVIGPEKHGESSRAVLVKEEAVELVG